MTCGCRKQAPAGMRLQSEHSDGRVQARPANWTWVYVRRLYSDPSFHYFTLHYVECCLPLLSLSCSTT
jgi:hypothetical protein